MPSPQLPKFWCALDNVAWCAKRTTISVRQAAQLFRLNQLHQCRVSDGKTPVLSLGKGKSPWEQHPPPPRSLANPTAPLGSCFREHTTRKTNACPVMHALYFSSTFHLSCKVNIHQIGSAIQVTIAIRMGKEQFDAQRRQEGRAVQLWAPRKGKCRERNSGYVP